MLTDERYKQLMEDVGLPNSRSLLHALKQCAMEAVLSERAVLAKAGEQEPVGFIKQDLTPLLYHSRSRKLKPDDLLYAHPLPAQAVPEVTPEMLRAAQLNSELGAYACSNLAGAYGCITELFNVMLSAAPNP